MRLPERKRPMVVVLMVRFSGADDEWSAVRAACADTFETRGLASYSHRLSVVGAAFAALAAA